ncbi:acyl-CoA dehydrogenase family protein [Rhodococcus qingshengii]|uniref:acyl-CoA dehydrogenase family protein n=1 Tax=Rhodococcus qingshengii TaxID=334542 RepID=UPI0024B95DF4|nr:acyl-CoA dehydrogenase family protein [Rhodococcus qingshengii]MDJ0490927.1 acyl-CoA dehydrogenase family protein [Rhodococcus qingshengii]
MHRTMFTDDHHEFRASVVKFVARHVGPRVDDFVAGIPLDRDLWREAGDQGLLGLEIPEAHGGSDARDFRFNAVLTEELAKSSLGLASSFAIHTDTVAPYLVGLTTPEQKDRWLPKFCTGETVTALGMTEPGGGSDVGALRTTARRDGGRWIINGTKTFITNGGSADLVLVAASTDPEAGARGITLFGIDYGVEGFTRGRKLDKVGMPESDTSELSFSEVIIDDSCRIGDVGRGFFYMMERLPRERLIAAVSNIAHARQIFAETLCYVKDRRAFGRAIGEFQHNKFILAEIATQLDVTQTFVDQLVKVESEGQVSAVLAAKAKWWTAEVQNKVIDQCVQLHGGYGFMNEYRVAQAWKDARVTKIWGGTNEIMKEVIGRDLGL